MSLINALKSYKQCDEDGIMCKVSRQAVDEAIERIKQLQAENERLRKEVEVQGFNLRLREIDGSMDMDALIKDAERWRENLPVIVDIAEDLEGYIDQQWQSRDQYQDQRRKYDRDMESVRKLKEAIDAAMEGE